jgi:hypothetical protein
MSGHIQPDNPSLLDDLRFLTGQWQALSRPGEPTGGFRFTAQLQARVLVRTNYADYPATSERPASRHEDLMVIYQEARMLRADYYDNEGHVIRYSGKIPGVNSVVFTSEPAASNPVFRLSYQLSVDGELKGLFEIAPPDTPDTFAPYLSWSAVKEIE